ncbi:hypothetical protein M422DRAFT_252991 [Sphaerobolus stellatus SS14]|uniref:Uncharacterized protein n=1 Tax=Sphaerobolus stellatus (strain SS14) TaxID=990650 RepID=A0A0C9UKZ8_SPHS4|nr:hypothetical protein M422DRAFT_252991 [Sphaerobolus stellatus SS14]
MSNPIFRRILIFTSVLWLFTQCGTRQVWDRIVLAPGYIKSIDAIHTAIVRSKSAPIDLYVRSPYMHPWLDCLKVIMPEITPRIRVLHLAWDHELSNDQDMQFREAVFPSQSLNYFPSLQVLRLFPLGVPKGASVHAPILKSLDVRGFLPDLSALTVDSRCSLTMFSRWSTTICDELGAELYTSCVHIQYLSWTGDTNISVHPDHYGERLKTVKILLFPFNVQELHIIFPPGPNKCYCPDIQLPSQ